MPLYCVTYFLNSISIFSTKRTAILIKYVVLVLLIFMSGTRYYIGGTDVYIYEGIYNNVPSVENILEYVFLGVNNGVNENYEIGFLLICSIVKSLNFSYFGFLLLYSTVFYILMYKGLRYFSDNWAVFICIFMYKIMFYNTFISIRQGMTLAVFCYILRYIKSRNVVKYFIGCFIAFFLHRAALVLFPLYFMHYLPISKRIVSLTAICFAPTWFIRERIDLGGVLENIIQVIGFEHKTENWVEVSEPISLLHTIECYMIIFLIIFFYNEIVRANEDAELIIKLVLVTVPIFTILSNWIVMTRIKDYFVILYGIILGYLNTARINKNTKMSIMVVIVVVCFIGMIRYVYVFDGGTLMEYKSFVFNGGRIFMRGISDGI